MKNSKNVLIIAITAALSSVITFAVTVFCLYNYVSKLPVPFEKIIKVSEIIDSAYIEDIDSEKAEEYMLNALIESLDDKYAVYYDAENVEETAQLLDGYYIGIGIETFANTEQDKIEVISAYKGTPADKAGIRGGDLIVAIDKKEYSTRNMADAVNYMRGTGEENPLEKELIITVLRGEELIDFNLKREKIELYKVESEIIDGICYIRYSGFTTDSARDVKDIVTSLDNSVKGIVIDVRNNPGGDFYSAIEMCDHFLDDETIMYTLDKKGTKNVFSAKKGKCELPLAIIVNESSASAAEIFAGSLQSNGRAVVVGAKTYGKGVTQTFTYIDPENPSKGAVKITTFKNYTPDGRWINNCIIPDIEITEEENSNIREDAAFKAAVSSIEKGN